MNSKVGKKMRVVLVTCGSQEQAQRIASAVVEARLAACVNLLEAPVRSIFRWKGNVETAAEFLLVIKTAEHLLPDLQEEIVRLHSYEVPEFIALPVVAGSEAYLGWLAANVRSAARPKTKPRSGKSRRR